MGRLGVALDWTPNLPDGTISGAWVRSISKGQRLTAFAMGRRAPAACHVAMKRQTVETARGCSWFTKNFTQDVRKVTSIDGAPHITDLRPPASKRGKSLSLTRGPAGRCGADRPDGRWRDVRFARLRRSGGLERRDRGSRLFIFFFEELKHNLSKQKYNRLN